MTEENRNSILEQLIELNLERLEIGGLKEGTYKKCFRQISQYSGKNFNKYMERFLLVQKVVRG